MKKDKWGAVDYIVAIITITICIAIIIAVIAPMIRGEIMAADQSKTLASVVTAAISIISMYVGAKLQRKIDKD